MSTQNQTSELEYCETCGTMLVMGNCRRCNPVTKTQMTRTKTVRQSIKPKTINTNFDGDDRQNIHAIAVNKVESYLNQHDINTKPSNDRGVDFILDDGRTILVRGRSNLGGDILLMNGNLDTLKSDVIIYVNGLKSGIINYYIIDMATAKFICRDHPYINTGRSDYFIHPYEYEQYKNNISLII